MDYRKQCYESFISKHWDFSHSLSQQQFEHLWKIYKKRFSNILPIDKSAKIIDIACGAGYFLYYLQKEGYINACGIDFSQEQLEIAQKMGVKNIQKADIFKYLPNNKETYDMIVANDIIEHLTKDEIMEFLDLIHKALKPSGEVLISTVNAQSLLGASTVFVDFTHETGFTPVSLSQVMRVCKFEDVVVYGERPIPYDLRSTVRSILWWVVDKLLKMYVSVERGTGRGMWKCENIFEPRIYAIGRKKI
ncbi:MAG: hypothetical protein AMJ45_00740 [Syntrophobacter sp. DG_60]|nr:MAG: hypothetical protein AMJ45_00740 [Syntrophobacter sp. DG_60]